MEFSNYKVSVIVPVFKVEKYLDQCIESIVNQTYENIEIILVDDGSPDGCPKICDEWKKKDNRIKVIHKKNGGLSDARNAGLDIATGDFISFVDSDDVIDIEMIKKLISIFEKCDCDVVECEYLTFHDELPKKEEEINRIIRSYTAKEALSALIDEIDLKYTAWNKIYRREVFETLRFEVGKLHEDVFCTYQVFGLCSNIIKTNDALYYYRQRKDSIMGSQFSMSNLDSLEARYRQYLYIKEKFPDLSSKAQQHFLGSCLYFGQKALNCTDRELSNQLLNEIIRYFKDVYDSNIVKNKNKQIIWFQLAKVNFILCCKIRNSFKIGF